MYFNAVCFKQSKTKAIKALKLTIIFQQIMYKYYFSKAIICVKTKKFKKKNKPPYNEWKTPFWCSAGGHWHTLELDPGFRWYGKTLSVLITLFPDLVNILRSSLPSSFTPFPPPFYPLFTGSSTIPWTQNFKLN